ncbi:protein kinase domain-containing protein, partial [Corallococcus terminator]|uniref:serine/threonine-protein kinase n=1 Tax=Corallococcus terminator TaxID=2316733 RepID=UPI001FC974CD
MKARPGEASDATRPARPPTEDATQPLAPAQGVGVAGTAGSDRLSRQEPPPSVQVGRYLLLRPLGQGGMGVVYAAYDPDLDRKVALKLLRPDGNSDSDVARARLLREAQAMARISHPHVIPVFDVGVWGAQVFLAMELIDGGTLGQWLKQAPRSWREVLEVYLAAGRGLVAAHAVGLVHRDFKPANVLVDRRGRVCVTDFGLARQVGTGPGDGEDVTGPVAGSLPMERRMLDAPITLTGAVMGTPQYMSPEQVLGAAPDASTDQFSFCAALYYALYGQRPFDTERMQALRIPADLSGPQAPSILEPPRDSRVPAWVRQALMRGLSLRPEERFPTLSALLEALGQEQRRTRRRRAWAVAGVGATVLAVAGGALHQQSRVCAGADALMAEVWSPEQHRRLEQSFVATGSPLATDMAARVAGALDAYADAWSRQRTDACEATRVSGTQPEALMVERVVCLERRRNDARAVVALLSTADRPLVEKALSSVNALPSLGECADVAALGEQQHLPEDPAKRAEVERLEAKLSQVKVLVDGGRLTQARDELRPLVEGVQATGYAPLRARLHLQQGWMREQLGESKEAATSLRQAAFDAEEGRSDRLKVLILNRLLYVEEGQKHFEQAEVWSGFADATLRRMGGDAGLEAEVRINQGNLASAKGDLPRARALFDEAQAKAESVLPEGHPLRARITFLQGGLATRMGDAARGVRLLTRALAQTEAAVGPLHPDTARRHDALSWALRETGDAAGALAHARASVEIRKTLLGPHTLPVAEGLDEVGMCLLALGRFDEALRVYEEALAMKRQVAPDDESLQYSHDGVGQALLGLGRAKDAIAPLRRAVGYPSIPEAILAESGFALAKALWDAGEPVPARQEAETARERFTRATREAQAAQVTSWLQAHPPTSTPARPEPRR